MQVSEKIVNAVVRFRIFALFGYFLLLVQIILGFVAVKILHDDEASVFRAGIFICPYVGTLLVSLGAFSMAGNVIRTSSKWILLYKGRSKSSVTRRMCRSLTPLRVQFGNNFVEPLTPLVIQEFCVRQTASLLILST